MSVNVNLSNNDEARWREDGEICEELMQSGPAGIAAATAIASGKKKRSVGESVEGNTCVLRRQQNRLLRKLSGLLDEYVVRVGQQAAVVCVEDNNSIRIFGSQPLETVVKRVSGEIEGGLGGYQGETMPARGAFQLPPLTLDGRPVALNKMTQAHLRYFVPEMLKHSNVKGKPGWGKDECRPGWWPEDIPWCNVRSDCRTAAQKKAMPWTKALRKIVRSCYQHHGRLDLLHETIPLSGDNSALDNSTKDNSIEENSIVENSKIDQKAYYYVGQIGHVVELDGSKQS